MNFFGGFGSAGNCTGGCDCCSILLLIMLLQCCGCGNNGCSIDICSLLLILALCGCGNGHGGMCK